MFRIDPRPYQLEVTRLTSALAEAEQTVPQLKAALKAAEANTERLQAQRKLAQITLDRDLGIQKENAGAISQQRADENRRNLDSADTSVLAAQADAEQAQIAIALGSEKTTQTKAQLEKAKIDLEETTVRAPADGFVTNLELQPGFVVNPAQAVMTFVCNPEGIVVATFPQEYLGTIESGNTVEVALDMYPGRMLHGKVESVIWATGQGQLAPSGVLPSPVENQPRGRFAVKIRIDEADQQRFRLAAGAGGSVAIYTNYGKSMKIVRKVMIRWCTWLNYIKISM